MGKLEEEADKWVFEINGNKWSNNDNTAGDNYGSFMAGATSKWVESQRIKAQIEILNKIVNLSLKHGHDNPTKYFCLLSIKELEDQLEK